jgi:hypothetical protein
MASRGRRVTRDEWWADDSIEVVLGAHGAVWYGDPPGQSDPPLLRPFRGRLEAERARARREPALRRR